MCGICGKLNLEDETPVSPRLLKAMADSIMHRGPDDEGYYASGPVGFGFRRLSIIDLKTGHQPICNEDGSAWVIFNGEIYNYRELRDFLLSKGHCFKTQTDTEVIVHLYEEMGEACVEKLRGMFAFAVWDVQKRTLLLARDRVGIKPLYYCLRERSLLFASEIKAILADPEVRAEVNPAMIDRFLSFYYLPGEETLFRGISKLAPGNYMVVRNGRAEIYSYWDLQFRHSSWSLQRAERELERILDESVRLHMISDVPVGFLLSGGVDSTAMLKFAVGKTAFPLSSYTLGFSEPGLIDERPYARLAAGTFGSEHHELTISASDFRDFLPQYVWYMEEPVCEPPAINLYYVSRLAKDFVKVLISGEGGDEAFAGYQDYRRILWVERMKALLGPLGPAAALGLSGANRVLRSNRLSSTVPLLRQPFPEYYYSRVSSPFSFFNCKFHELYTPDFLQHVDKSESLRPVTRYMHDDAGHDRLEKMLYIDTKTWLTDDLLVKADKMTMANSVELRVPLLDHKVLEFAASLPAHFKVRGFTTKYIAKRALKRHVPATILNRRKTGFPVPYAAWLRKELHDWMLAILLDRQTLERGYFEKRAIEELIAQDMREGGGSKELFCLIVLELWHRCFTTRSGSEPHEVHVSPRGVRA